jgi:hypothetical protein
MCTVTVSAQSYTYSYTDPCNGTTKTLSVPINGTIAVSYYGQLQSFSYAELTNGALQNWAVNIYDQYGGNNPCASIVGLPTALNVTQGTVYNTINILGTLSMLADVASVAGATNMLGGITNSIGNTGAGSNSDNSSDVKSNNSSSNSNSSSSSTGSTNQDTNPSGGSSNNSSTSNNTNDNQSNGNTTNDNQSGNTNQSSSDGSASDNTGNSGTSTEGSTTGSTSGSNTTQEEGGGSTNITAGGTNTVKADNNSSSSNNSKPSPKEGGKPQVIASSDFVGFNFRNSEVRTGLKATGGYSALRWDGARASGVLADYTSAQKGPNITGYYAFIKTKSTTLISATTTFGFEGLGSQYGTIAIGQMRSFKSKKFPKINKLKVVYMATASYGYVYKEAFIGTAMIAGGMYDMKIGKRIDIKLMNLLVYAPYVSYYNDIVLTSPFVVLPSIGTNIGITKRFKFNINTGGAWAIKAAAMNYTITMGTRLML